jgi:glycosyl transferase, family 25
MNLAEQFEQIAVINLASRADRRREMAGELARVGLSLHSPPVKLFNAIRPHERAGFESVGARGCFLSHLEVLRAAIGRRSLLILEDDLSFVADIVPALARLPSRLPSDWGMFYGGYRIEAECTAAPLTLVAPRTSIGTTHFVAFNGAAIGAVVDYLQAILTRPPGHPEGGPMHVDGAYSRFRADTPDLHTYVAVPELGRQRASRTDIHDLRWFDRAPIVRVAVEHLRRRRATARRRSSEGSA